MPSVLLDFVACYRSESDLRISLVQLLNFSPTIFDAFEFYVQLILRHVNSCPFCTEQVAVCCAGEECVFFNSDGPMSYTSVSLDMSGISPLGALTSTLEVHDFAQAIVCTDCRRVAHKSCVDPHACCNFCLAIRRSNSTDTGSQLTKATVENYC